MTSQRLQLRGLGPDLEDRVWEATDFLGVGRLENQEVLLTDASISRRHAEIELTDGGWVVRDLGSTNGTFVNGVRVGRADQGLHKGDTIQCGNCGLMVAALEQLTPANLETPGRGMQVEVAVRNTWEQALLEAAPLEELAHIPGRDQLLTLLRIGRDFCGVTALDELLQSLLTDALAALKAQSGAIVLVDEDTGQPGSTVVSTRQTESGPYYSKTLAQRALCAGESLLCHDIREEREAHHAGNGNGIATRSIICAVLRSPRQRLGLLQLDRGPGQPVFNRHELALADALAASVSATIESVRSFLHREHALLLQTLTALAQAVDLRDDYTGSHTQRVTDFALLLAEELHLSPAQRMHLQNGTPLHDIGKIGISDEILRKPGRLSEEEVEYMRSHTWKGAALLEAIPSFAPLIPIVRSHHERWDSRGYPDGLSGSDIPLLARIVAVADAFDAMTSDRPYRPALTVDKALEEIQSQAGGQFDPECAAAFVPLRPKLMELLAEREGMLATVKYAVLPLPEKRTEPGLRTLAIPRKNWTEFLQSAKNGVQPASAPAAAISMTALPPTPPASANPCTTHRRT